MGMDAAFATLGLAPGAPPIEVTRAFRALSRASHPDHGGDRTRFEAVLSAYRALQAAGLSGRTSHRSSPPRTRARAVAEAACSPAARRYRDFLRDLDAAAAIHVAAAPPSIPAAPAGPSSRVSHTGERFAKVLERVLSSAAA
jgi:hypothetical protein